MQSRLDELDRITKEHLAMDKSLWKGFRDLDESRTASQNIECDSDCISNDLSLYIGSSVKLWTV